MFKLKISARRRAIFAAYKALGIADDSERHGIQRAVVGKQSLSDMSLPELDTLLDHLNTITRGAYPGIPANIEFTPYLQKIEALLADMGLPWSYAEAIAQNITGGKKPQAIKKLAWIKRDEHFRGIVAALDKKHNKLLQPARESLWSALAARGIADVEAWARGLIDTQPGIHTADHSWDSTLETLERLTAMANKT